MQQFKGIIFNGKGILVPVIFGISFALLIAPAALMEDYLGIKTVEFLPIIWGVAFIVAGFFTSLVGKDFIKVDGKEVEIDLDNRFFFIKMNFLGKASIFIGIAITIFGVINILTSML